jgi:hypothetical protein
LDYLPAELKAVINIDGISAHAIQAVNLAEASFADLSEHDIEKVITNLKLFEHFFFREIRFFFTALVGVQEKGIEQ